MVNSIKLHWRVLCVLIVLILIQGTFGHAPLQAERLRGFQHKRQFTMEQLQDQYPEHVEDPDNLIHTLELRQEEEEAYIKEASSPRFRLNDTFIPSHYEVELLILLDNDPMYGSQFTAPGKVIINFKPTRDTNVLTLHANLLAINQTSVKIKNVDQPSQIINIITFSNDTASGRHFFTMNLDAEIVSNGSYQFQGEFIAPISTDRMNGLYLSVYTEPDTGRQGRHLATQMESYHLRQVFPCFDEPNLKATYNLTIIRKNNYTTLANEEISSTQSDPTRPGWSIDKITVPIPIAPYLLALVVSDFTYSEADASLYPGVRFRVYAPPYMIAQGGGNYSANVSAIILKYLDDYFQSPYPLSKMDSVAVSDFSAGAMENWGLNLYRISLLILYPGITLESERFSITNVLVHELAHQHFGNLVTCKWWSEIWLNEGFATYVNYFGMDSVAPEFKGREMILTDAFQYSMPVDVSTRSHPLRNDALTPPEIDSYFSGITYEKGGSVNRMVEGFLTKETFQKGLQYYLQEMKHLGAEQDDLFRNLEKAAQEDNRLPPGFTMKEIMDTWTLQSGHPIVRVSVASSDLIYISQERYGPSSESGLWYVPITIVTQDKPNLENFIPEIWLEKQVLVRSHPHNTSTWIMINQDAYGYYRVLYDTQLITLIQKQLVANASMITPLSRSQLLDDYFTLAFLDYVNIEIPLSLTQYLAQEDHFTVWDVVTKHLRKPYNLLSGNATSFNVFKAYLLPRLEAALIKIGIIQSPEHIGADALYRVQLLDWACSMEHPACSNYSINLFTQWLASPNVNPVPIDIQGVMFCAMVTSGGKPALDFILERYKELPANSTVRPRLRNALACSNDPVLIQEVLNLILTNTSGLVPSDRIPLLQRIASNSAARNLSLSFLETRFNDILTNIGDGSPSPFASVFTTLSNYLNTQTDLDRLTAFISNHTVELAPVNNSLQSSLNNLRSNIQHMNQFGYQIIDWLGSA